MAQDTLTERLASICSIIMLNRGTAADVAHGMRQVIFAWASEPEQLEEAAMAIHRACFPEEEGAPMLDKGDIRYWTYKVEAEAVITALFNRGE